MKILFLTNNEISNKLIHWLENEAKEELIAYDKPIDLEFIKKLKPDFVISYNYRLIISKKIIDYMKGNIINLHISLLPWNKGAYPNVWSFLEDTPKGVTIHIIDEGVDTGSILIQKEVDINENIETLRSSYEKLHKEIQELFKKHWNNIKNKELNPKLQKLEGSMHYIKDFKRIEHLFGDNEWDISIIGLKKRYKKLIGDQDVYKNS
jgi:methionyl-tRNA formyltransferase